MKEIYQMNEDELYSHMETDIDGLSKEQAAKILEEKGPNSLQEGKKKTALQVFFEQFCDFLVVILIVAAVISMFSGNIESTIVIFVVIVARC